MIIRELGTSQVMFIMIIFIDLFFSLQKYYGCSVSFELIPSRLYCVIQFFDWKLSGRFDTSLPGTRHSCLHSGHGNLTNLPSKSFLVA